MHCLKPFFSVSIYQFCFLKVRPFVFLSALDCYWLILANQNTELLDWDQRFGLSISKEICRFLNPTASVLEVFFGVSWFWIKQNHARHCVACNIRKAANFLWASKKGENYFQKPMPKLFSTVFSCSPRTVFSGVKRQKVKLQLTVTVLSQRYISQVLYIVVRLLI